MNKKTNPGLVKTIFVLVHTIFLLVTAYYIQISQFDIGDEKLFVKTVDLLENHLMRRHSVVDHSRFLFLNTSKSKMLLPAYLEDTDVQIGNDAITDREDLLKLLNALHGTEFKYLMLNVFFNSQTVYDSSIQANLFALKKNIVASHYENNVGILLPSIEGWETGVSNIPSLDNEAYKFRLTHDGHRTIALIMHQEINQANYEPGLLFHKLDGQRVQNDFTLPIRIRNDESFNYLELGELLLLSQKSISDIVKDKIVVVGDFESNSSNSIGGTISGSLLQLNAFLALEEGNARVPLLLIVIVVIFFLLITLLMFELPPFPRSRKRRVRGLWIVIIIVTVSFLIYYHYGKYINLFFLIIYIYIIRKYFLSVIEKLWTDPR